MVFLTSGLSRTLLPSHNSILGALGLSGYLTLFLPATRMSLTRISLPTSPHGIPWNPRDQHVVQEPPMPLWPRTIKNLDVNTVPLARPFNHSLAPLTHSLALHCSLGSHATLCLFVRLLTYSLPSSWENEWLMPQNQAFLNQSGMGGNWNIMRESQVRIYWHVLIRAGD